MKLRPVRRALGRLLVGAARLLPPPRGQALVAGAKAAFTLVTGRPTSVTRGALKASARRTTGNSRTTASSGARRDTLREAPGQSVPARANGGDELPEAAREELARAETALERAQFSEAWQLTERLARDHPATLRVLQLRAAALAWSGDVAERAKVLHRLHMLRDDPAVRRQERVVVGRLVETSPGWLPRIPGPGEPVLPASNDMVLYLVNESGPYLATASTERLRANLHEAVHGGLRPEVATALGFPRGLGMLEFAPVDVVDGIPHHRLDLGPHYPLDGPRDLLLRDTAWLAANLVRRIRPAIVHAIPGDESLGLALVGAALRQHFGVPLVYEGGPTARGSASDASAGRAAAVSSVMHIADHVITFDASMRDRIVAGGVDAGRISIIAGADEAPDYGSRIRGVYERVLAARAADGLA